MTDLTTALDRLSRAVDRLEAAAVQCLDRTDDEKRRLSAELKILHAEYSGLSGITDQVSRHLDETIVRLETVIGDHEGELRADTAREDQP